ncbi:PE-PGRS family protein [Kitasatospora sp. NPDC058478]|uniref:PE-PGRS family protein n=1 Tax=unclassified Kitasatospora TaxID=2633591 RepID=UPI00366A419C
MSQLVVVGYDGSMLRWSPLNERQLSLLTRIGGDGSPVTSDESELAHSARALKERGLISMPKAEGVKWRAEITDAGRFYLEHGHHPDRPAPKPKTTVRAPADTASKSRPTETDPPRDQAATRASAVQQQPKPPKESRTVSGPALIEQVRQAGRFLRIPDPSPEERARLRRSFDAARTCAPDGYQLKYSGREKGDFFLGLLRTNGLDETEWNRIRLQRSRVITDVDDVIAAVKADHSAFEISEDVLPRVLSIVRLIAEEALSRHGNVTILKKRRQVRPMLSVHGKTWEIEFKERQRHVKYVPAPKGRRKTYDWQRVTPAHRSEPSGELDLYLVEPHHSYNRANAWTKECGDTPSRQLEEQIGAAFRALRARAEEQETHRLAYEAGQRRLKEERERAETERRRLEAEEKERKQRKWEKAVAAAKVHAAEAARAETFGAALDRWRAAAEIRRFCAELEESVSRATSVAEAERLRQWAKWGGEEADRIDPTSPGRGLGVEDFETEPTDEALRHFLKGWSPHRPVKETPPAEPAQPPRQPDPWRDLSASPRDQGWKYGPQGRAQWWRR